MNKFEILKIVALRRSRKYIYKKTQFDIFLRAFRIKNYNDKKYFLLYSPTEYYGTDVRGIWEKNRFHWLVLEIIKNGNTQDGAKLFVRSVKSWVKDNPLGYGINWISPMEAAIRVSNWIAAFDVIKNNVEISTEFSDFFYNQVECHGNFIRRNLEVVYTKPLGNHFLSDIAGLLNVAFYLSNDKLTSSWLFFAKNELEKQMESQVLNDGVSFENSIGYHRYILEIFLYSTLVCLKNNIALNKAFLTKLEKMLEFVMHYIRPDANAPNIGDSDDGLWIPFSENIYNDKYEHRHLLTIGAILFNRSDFKNYGYELSNTEKTYLDSTSILKWNQIEKIGTKLTTASFNEGGFYFMRSDDIYINIITQNQYPHPVQYHKHNDIFSFELCVGNSPFIIDSGTFTYTADKEQRNYFRSTKAHNTILIDNFEQQTISDNYFFALEKKNKIKNINWISNSDKDIFSAELSLNCDSNIITHSRKFIFDKAVKKLEIIDLINGNSSHLIEINFHIFPEAKIKLKGNQLLFELNSKFLLMILDEKLKINIIDKYVSLKYGQKIQTKCVQLHCQTTLPVEIKSTIKLSNFHFLSFN